MKLTNISKFEKHNENTAVNVLGYEGASSRTGRGLYFNP